MNVVATQKGYHGGEIREPGDTFTVENKKQFSDKWMEEVKPATKSRSKASPKTDDTEADPGDQDI